MCKSFLSALTMFLWVSSAIGGEVPPPAATPVELVVSGRTSTLVSITIQDVGQEIPATFSGDQLKNSPGFTWYVSRHYALQTDYDAARARHLLTLLELAYPHYVEAFGQEIPNDQTTRMAVVYGASTDSLRRVLLGDGIDWSFHGGGITFEGIRAAFNYPSGSLQYHQRYIMLHECVHLFQMCLNGTVGNTPAWYFEGIADGLAHHVWEESAQRLTMGVTDKPTITNWYDDGLEDFTRTPFKLSDLLGADPSSRARSFLIYTFFSSTPDRLARFRVWRDEISKLGPGQPWREPSARLMEQLFGTAKLDADFDAWVRTRRSSFHYVDWGWEQDGDTLFSYGWPQSGPFSQTNLNFPPGQTPVYDPFVMDYPFHPQSPLVGAVERGVPEPTIGCLIGFQDTPDTGAAGLGLGVEGRSMVRILIEQRRSIVVDGTDLGAGKSATELGEEFRAATAQTMEVGLTVRIAAEGLEITVRGGKPGNIQSVVVTLPLDQAQRQRVLSSPVAVLSRDGRHRLTPYVDDRRKPEPDLSIAAPPNRWRFALQPRLQALVRAGWCLGASAPASLHDLQDELAGLAGTPESRSRSAIERIEERLSKVRLDIRSSGADEASIEAALEELALP